MSDCRPKRWVVRPRPVRPQGSRLALPATFPAMLLALLLAPAADGIGQTAPEAASPDAAQPALQSELTLPQFRHLAAARLAQAAPATGRSRDPQPPPDLRPADEVFLQLLLIQARDAAVNQSMERLSEWSKSIQSRFRIQNAPQLDLDVARFEEARMAAESSRIEAEQARIIERANRLLGRPPATPLLAILAESDGAESNAAEKRAGEVLAQGEELVAKMYQSYQFGGITLTSLMEYEKVVFEVDLEYRQTLARTAMRAAAE